jgi:hypothetical protein
LKNIARENKGMRDRGGLFAVYKLCGSESEQKSDLSQELILIPLQVVGTTIVFVEDILKKRRTKTTKKLGGGGRADVAF